MFWCMYGCECFIGFAHSCNNILACFSSLFWKFVKNEIRFLSQCVPRPSPSRPLRRPKFHWNHLGQYYFHIPLIDFPGVKCRVQCRYDGQQIADPYDCHSFYVCSNWISYKHMCPLFNHTDRLIFHPLDWACVSLED